MPARANPAAPLPVPGFAPGDARAAVDALIAVATASRFGDPAQGLRAAQEARAAAEAAGYREGVAWALRQAGMCRCLLTEWDAALDDLHAAAERFAELGDSVGRAGALSWSGNVRWRRSDYPAALALHLEALQLQRAAGDRAGESDTLNWIGNVYYHVGEYARALEHYHHSLRLKEELGDRRGQSQCFNNIGNIHGRLGDYDNALHYHTRTLELKRELGDPAGEGIALVNVGSSHEAKGDYPQALEFYRAALEHCRAAGERLTEADALRDLGDVHRKLGQLDAALDFYRQGLDAARAVGGRYVEAETLIGLGETHVEAGDAAAALETLREGLAIAEAIESRRLVFEAHRALSAACEAAGDSAGGLHHFKAYHRVEDEVFSAESEKRIQSILVQAELERTHQEAELLRVANDELTGANRALREADEEKAHLLDELRRQAGELDRLTREDSLTGLHNRRHIDEQLALEWERARRFGRDLSVVLADLDHFKEVNDRFSHATGDEVLRIVGDLLRQGTRGIDVVGRYGGEEFVLLLVETPPDRAVSLCDKLRLAIAEHDWESIAPGLTVTISIGVAGDLSLGSPAALLAAADARLYEAKRRGRNCVAG